MLTASSDGSECMVVDMNEPITRFRGWDKA
jgi:hypothetical protein